MTPAGKASDVLLQRLEEESSRFVGGLGAA